MEKKTKFKLKYVKSHLLKSKIHKSHKSLKKCKRPATQNPLIPLLKYFEPIQNHRVVGDLVFLDQVPSDSNEFVGLSSLWANFKTIKDIKVSPNFILCSFEDNKQFSQVELLTERLKSLGNKDSFELATAIEEYMEKFSALPFSAKASETVSTRNWQLEFNKCIKAHENEPLLFYHYQKNENLRTKIGANKILKEMTFGDDIRLFEESIFVVPASDYFIYMRNHLKACFGPNHELVRMYMQTINGVKQINAICYSFLLQNEKIIVLTFPRELQSPDIQSLYDRLLKNDHQVVPEKTCRNFVYKNLETWEALMKSYFEPWTKKKEQYNIIKREESNCHYIGLMAGDADSLEGSVGI